MAIGDTVQAGLMRVDFSPIARAGEAQARANQAFGDAVGGVINKFYQKKKDKQEREEREQAYLKMGLSDEEAKAASRDKDLANQFINKMNADRNYSLEMDKFNQAGELRDLQMQQIAQNMARQKDADQLAGQEQEKTTKFLNFLGQPGPDQIDPSGPDRNSVLRNMRAGQGATPPARMVPGPSPAEQSVMSPQAKKFIRDSVLQKQPMDKVLPMAKQIDAQIAQSQLKPMTPKELADYEAKLIANETNRIKLNDLKNPPALPAPPEPVYMESALDAIDDAITLVGKDSMFNPTAGFGSETAKSIGGSDAADLEAALSTITSAVGFKRLQDMREASPTGGALGSVSERELSQLNAALGSISQKQSKEQLKKNLLKIKDHYQKAVDAINAQRIAYNSGLTFKTQEEALKYIQSQKSSNAIRTDQGNYTIPGLSVEAQ